MENSSVPTVLTLNDEGVGFYDGSNPWDVNNVYALDSSVLNYGGKNTIAIRTCNSSGGGGWYQGPVGIYTVAAYNKAAGKPSVYASDDIAGAVKEAAAAQQNALETENIEAYQNTLSVEYYESGYDRARRVAQASDWMNIYDNIKVTDTGVGVFVDGDLYNYQAARVITGEKDGETVEILNDPEVSEYYKVEDGQTIMYGSHPDFSRMIMYPRHWTEQHRHSVYICRKDIMRKEMHSVIRPYICSMESTARVRHMPLTKLTRCWMKRLQPERSSRVSSFAPQFTSVSEEHFDKSSTDSRLP